MRRTILLGLVSLAAVFCAASFVSAQVKVGDYTFVTKEGDFVAHDFKFSDGQTLPEVKLHYTTLGTPQRDANGRVTNAVLILHGTNRAGRVWLVPSFAGALFAPGQLLDASKYYLILPDQLGAGLGNPPNRATVCAPDFRTTIIPTWFAHRRFCWPRDCR